MDCISPGSLQNNNKFCYQQHTSAVEVSLQKSLNLLIDLSCGRTGFNIQYGCVKSLSLQKKELKRQLYNALFSRNRCSEKSKSTEWRLVSNFLPDISLSCGVLQFHMKYLQHSNKNVEQLNQLLNQVLQGGNSTHASVLTVIMLLANSGLKQQDDSGSFPERSGLFNLALQKGVRKQPYFINGKNGDKKSQLSDGEHLHLQMNEKEVELFSSLSLFKTLLANASLRLPTLFFTKELDLTQFVYTKHSQSNSIDEGCFTGSSKLESSVDSGVSSCNFSNIIELDDDVPYLGYRKPNYDVKVWEDNVKTSRSNYYSWETVNRSIDSCSASIYLSEAGDVVYDAIWQFRANLVHELATALRKRSGSHVLVPARTPSSVVDEVTLLFHVRLVLCGIASETFHFNSIANMFLPAKNVVLSGVTSSSLRSLLMNFAKWGTAYWRLLRFCSYTLTSSSFLDSENKHFKSVIFKAFCEGIRSYLYEYQKFILINDSDATTLLQRFFKFHRLGSQICYMCQLCQCGDPSSAFGLNWDNFPTGVSILSYVYEEALFCSESADHLVLLYLLRKCCAPYLKFVQNWVYHGMCWDLTGDFMIQVNPDNGNRKDRLRWSNYIVPLSAEDRKSTVPSFLLSISQSLFVCGKTIELLHHINPDHFLCTYSLDVPQLIVTYSQSLMESNGHLWHKFQLDMRELELQRTVSWRESEEKKKEEQLALVAAVRAEYDRALKEKQEIAKSLLMQNRKSKQAELLRLKEQAEQDAKRKRVRKLNEKSDDAVGNIFGETNNEENVRFNKAKEELISHYQKLSEEADRRKRKADWKVKRFALQRKRREFFETQKIYFAGKDELDLEELAKTKEFLHDALDTDSISTVQMKSDISTVAKKIENTAIFGKNISELGSEINPMHKKQVAGQHVSQESSSTTGLTESGFDVDGVRRKQVDGQHVSQESSSSKGNPASEIKPLLKKQVAGKHISLESSPRSGESLSELGAGRSLIRRKQVGGHHVSQETWLLSPESELGSNGNAKLKKPVGGHHVSQESFALPGKTDLRDQIRRKQVSGQHVSQTTISFESDASIRQTIKKNCPILQESTEETPRILRKPVENCHVSQSTMQSIFDEEEPPIIGDAGVVKKTSDKVLTKKSLRHVSDSSVQNLMYFEKTSTPLKSSDPLLVVPEDSLPDDVMRLSDDVSERNTSVVQASNIAQGHDENGNHVPTYYTLPRSGTYHDFIEMMMERLNIAERRNSTELLNRINLLSFYNGNNEEETDEETIGLSEDISLIDLHSLPNLLGNCIVQPIKWHAKLVNRCVVNYFMMDLCLPRHFRALRRFLLLEDGEFGSALSRRLFKMVHSGRKPVEILNPLNLDSILDHSLQASRESLSSHSNLSLAVKYLPLAFSTSNFKALDCLELCYYVEWPCNIVITRGSHAKYNQVLSFLLQLNYVSWALHDIRLRLNLLVSRPNSTSLRFSDVQKLQIYRYEMHNFVKVMQGYVSSQVLHVCWQEFWEDLSCKVNNLDDLHDRHAEYLNKCIMRCLLTKKAQNVMNVICDVLKSILRFQSQLAASVPLPLLNKTYQEFTRLSNFLFKVVSKLVHRGYQPHLEDFLTRLNFNEYYKS